MNEVDVMLPEEVIWVEIGGCLFIAPKGHGQNSNNWLFCLPLGQIEQIFVPCEVVELLVNQVALGTAFDHCVCEPNDK